MTDAAVKRPPLLAGACLYLGALSTIIAIRAVTLVSSWNAENRAADFARSLKALRDAGLSAEGAETFYRTLLTVVAVLAACAVVFAVYTSKGHRASRVGMTVLIGIVGGLTFLGVLGGTFFLAMVGALAVVFTIRLWTGEIRTYFRTLAGHAPPPPKAPKSAKSAAVTPDPFATHHPSEMVDATPSAQPAVTVGQYAPGQHPQGQYAQGPYAQGPYPPRPLRPPTSVAIVTWTTLIGSAIVLAGSGLSLLVLAPVGAGDYEQMMRDSPLGGGLFDSSNIDFEQAYRISLTLLSIFCALSLAGLVASILAMTKKRSGGVFLFVMAVVTLAVSFLPFPFGLPWTAAAIVCLVQLRKSESKAWFSRT